MISRSTFDLKRYSIRSSKSAARLCDGRSCLACSSGRATSLRWAASYGHTAESARADQRIFPAAEAPIDRGSVRRAAWNKWSTSPTYRQIADYAVTKRNRSAGYRAVIGVPLLQRRTAGGAVVIGKTVPHPFSDEADRRWCTTFADQAVIAIENARLLNELRKSAAAADCHRRRAARHHRARPGRAASRCSRPCSTTRPGSARPSTACFALCETGGTSASRSTATARASEERRRNPILRLDPDVPLGPRCPAQSKRFISPISAKIPRILTVSTTRCVG